MIFLYNLLLFPSFFLLLPYFLVRLITTKRYRTGLGERLGYVSSKILESFKGKKPIWVHAVSVGELVAAKPFLEAIRKNYSSPILLSTTTETGYRIAKKSFPQIPVLFFPFDLPLFSKRFVRSVSPKLFITIESEIWPNLLNILKKRGIPAVLVNGRLSSKSYFNYRRLGFFNRILFSQFTRLGMRSEREAECVVSLGAKRERVFVTGNLKYDAALSLRKSLINSATTNSPVVARFIEPKDFPVIVFGSLHPEEEEGIVQHCAQLRNEALLIFAPRHPEKSRLEMLFKKKGLNYILRSKIHPHLSPPPHPNPGDALPQVGRERGRGRIEEGKGWDKEKIIILNTIGELALFYSLATLVFVGGSLIPWGGHNILEPAVLEKPVLFGPYMGNFLEEATALKSAGGAIEVKNAESLFSTFSMLLTNSEDTKSMGEVCLQVVKQYSGATEKNLELIKGLI